MRRIRSLSGSQHRDDAFQAAVTSGCEQMQYRSDCSQAISKLIGRNPYVDSCSAEVKRRSTWRFEKPRGHMRSSRLLRCTDWLRETGDPRNRGSWRIHSKSECARPGACSGVTLHLANRRSYVRNSSRLHVFWERLAVPHGRIASLFEVCDKGKPGESRRRKATRLKRLHGRHVSRAAESHYPGGRIPCVLSC
jgi:hypothetical protein